MKVTFISEREDNILPYGVGGMSLRECSHIGTGLVEFSCKDRRPRLSVWDKSNISL